MELLPPEIITLIVDELTEKREFLRTCKKYYGMSKTLLINHKYAIFIVNSDYEGNDIFNFKGISDNLFICRQYIKKELLKNSKIRPSRKMTKENDYTLLLSRGKKEHCDYFDYTYGGFIIEEIVINEFI
jgi:hypothetical protein